MVSCKEVSSFLKLTLPTNGVVKSINIRVGLRFSISLLSTKLSSFIGFED